MTGIEIQMALSNPADPVPDLDRETALIDRRSSSREQFEQLSAATERTTSQIQSFACIPQRA